MAEIRPFRGLRFNPSMVGDLARVLCPPYDIVSAGQEEALRQRSSHNAIQLELRERHPGEAPDDDRYQRAARTFREWLDRGVLVPEPSPAMYLLEEEYTYGGVARKREGLLALARLEEFEKGIVLPHEHTRPGPKADRLALMRACRTNFSPIMALYRDPGGSIAPLLAQARKAAPAVSVAPNGQVGYRMWAVTQPNLLSRIRAAMAPRQIFVADGHHRYETALQFRNELAASEGPLSSNAAARFVMVVLVSMDDPGLLVLPYHRLLGGLSDGEVIAQRRAMERAFHSAPIPPPAQRGGAETIAASMEGELGRQPRDQMAVAALGLDRGRGLLMTLRESHRPAPGAPPLERCDTWLLHRNAIRAALGEKREAEAIAFVHDSAEAVGQVLRGEAQVAFLLRSLPMNLFEEVVGSGERLPPKSTYFYPKLPTGLVVNHLVGEL